ncbi:sigma-E factor negative regulatory protein, partial [bacterium]|nr:sigma-E factor negative regulatory protein [bacterium]
MNDNIKESLSALVDGETDELELRRILKAMEGEEATAETADSLRQRWSRYHLISAVIKNESVAVSDSGFLARVNAEIDGHEYQQSDNATFAGAASLNQTVSSVAAPSLAARAAPSQWSRFAVAASVALAVVIGVNQWRAADQNGVVPAPLTVGDRPVV